MCPVMKVRGSVEKNLPLIPAEDIVLLELLLDHAPRKVNPSRKVCSPIVQKV